MTLIQYQHNIFSSFQLLHNHILIHFIFFCQALCSFFSHLKISLWLVVSLIKYTFPFHNSTWKCEVGTFLPAPAEVKKKSHYLPWNVYSSNEITRRYRRRRYTHTFIITPQKVKWVIKKKMAPSSNMLNVFYKICLHSFDSWKIWKDLLPFVSSNSSQSRKWTPKFWVEIRIWRTLPV